MNTDNVIKMQDDLNLAATVSQIKEFENLLTRTDYVPRWKYIVVDNISGGYVRRGNEYSPASLIPLSDMFVYDIKTNEIELYDLNTATKLCEELNAQTDHDPEKLHFTPILWRRYCIIHLASLYDVLHKMDAKGKTKRFFASH